MSRAVGPRLALFGGATFAAVGVLLPETGTSSRPAPTPRLAELFRLPGFWRFVFAAGLIQVSHALYYGFASLHWRAAGHSGTVVGLLWAEGVIAEILLLACASA